MVLLLIFWLNFLPIDSVLDRTNLKAFADDNFIIAKFIISVSYGVENIVGKGANAGNQHFLLFPQCFSKALSLRSLKIRIVW